jgi:hypothetical protein
MPKWLLLTLCLLLPAAAQTPQSDSPNQVLEKYCARDAQGAWTSSDTATDMWPMVMWPDAPGWDVFTVIAEYKIAPATIHGSHATAWVRYTVLGTLSQKQVPHSDETTFYFVRKPHPERHLYRLLKGDQQWDLSGAPKLVKGPMAWRVESPQLGPYVSAGWAIELLQKRSQETSNADKKKIVAESVAQLQQMIAQNAGGTGAKN